VKHNHVTLIYCLAVLRPISSSRSLFFVSVGLVSALLLKSLIRPYFTSDTVLYALQYIVRQLLPICSAFDVISFNRST